MMGRHYSPFSEGLYGKKLHVIIDEDALRKQATNESAKLPDLTSRHKLQKLQIAN